MTTSTASPVSVVRPLSAAQYATLSTALAVTGTGRLPVVGDANHGDATLLSAMGKELDGRALIVRRLDEIKSAKAAIKDEHGTLRAAGLPSAVASAVKAYATETRTLTHQLAGLTTETAKTLTPGARSSMARTSKAVVSVAMGDAKAMKGLRKEVASLATALEVARENLATAEYVASHNNGATPSERLARLVRKSD